MKIVWIGFLEAACSWLEAWVAVWVEGFRARKVVWVRKGEGNRLVKVGVSGWGRVAVGGSR